MCQGTYGGCRLKNIFESSILCSLPYNGYLQYVKNEPKTRIRDEGIERAPRPCSSPSLPDRTQNKNMTANDKGNGK